MTPCRTEKVGFRKKKTIKNRITKKTTRQEEPPEKSKKNKKKNLHFPQFLFFFCFFVLFSCFFLDIFFLDFGFLVCFFFVCSGFAVFYYVFVKPYILCVAGLINLEYGTIMVSCASQYPYVGYL
jgi:uncharacterized membrane protein